MTQNDLFLQWLSEEQAAYIHGWDFSHIQDRYEECQSLPWQFMTFFAPRILFWIWTPAAESFSCLWGILIP